MKGRCCCHENPAETNQSQAVNPAEKGTFRICYCSNHTKTSGFEHFGNDPRVGQTPDRNQSINSGKIYNDLQTLFNSGSARFNNLSKNDVFPSTGHQHCACSEHPMNNFQPSPSLCPRNDSKISEKPKFCFCAVPDNELAELVKSNQSPVMTNNPSQPNNFVTDSHDDRPVRSNYFSCCPTKDNQRSPKSKSKCANRSPKAAKQNPATENCSCSMKNNQDAADMSELPSLTNLFDDNEKSEVVGKKTVQGNLQSAKSKNKSWLPVPSTNRSIKTKQEPTTDKASRLKRDNQNATINNPPSATNLLNDNQKSGAISKKSAQDNQQPSKPSKCNPWLCSSPASRTAKMKQNSMKNSPSRPNSVFDDDELFEVIQENYCPCQIPPSPIKNNELPLAMAGLSPSGDLFCESPRSEAVNHKYCSCPSHSDYPINESLSKPKSKPSLREPPASRQEKTTQNAGMPSSPPAYLFNDNQMFGPVTTKPCSCSTPYNYPPDLKKPKSKCWLCGAPSTRLAKSKHSVAMINPTTPTPLVNDNEKMAPVIVKYCLCPSTYPLKDNQDTNQSLPANLVYDSQKHDPGRDIQVLDEIPYTDLVDDRQKPEAKRDFATVNQSRPRNWTNQRPEEKRNVTEVNQSLSPDSQPRTFAEKNDQTDPIIDLKDLFKDTKEDKEMTSDNLKKTNEKIPNVKHRSSQTPKYPDDDNKNHDLDSTSSKDAAKNKKKSSDDKNKDLPVTKTNGKCCMCGSPSDDSYNCRKKSDKTREPICTCSTSKRHASRCSSSGSSNKKLSRVSVKSCSYSTFYRDLVNSLMEIEANRKKQECDKESTRIESKSCSKTSKHLFHSSKKSQSCPCSSSSCEIIKICFKDDKCNSCSTRNSDPMHSEAYRLAKKSIDAKMNKEQDSQCGCDDVSLQQRKKSKKPDYSVAYIKVRHHKHDHCKDEQCNNCDSTLFDKLKNLFKTKKSSSKHCNI